MRLARREADFAARQKLSLRAANAFGNPILSRFERDYRKKTDTHMREHARIAHTSLTCLGELTSDTLSASLANDVRRRKRRLASTVNVDY